MSSAPLAMNAFRANVGIVLIDGSGRVLALERSDASGAWQMPQGGLLEGEEPRTAAERELFEETGIGADKILFIAEHPAWLAYELPLKYRCGKTGRGQAQKWFLFRFLGGEGDIDLRAGGKAEFSAWKWIPLRELARETVAFRRWIYGQLAEEFHPHLAQ